MPFAPNRGVCWPCKLAIERERRATANATDPAAERSKRRSRNPSEARDQDGTLHGEWLKLTSYGAYRVHFNHLKVRSLNLGVSGSYDDRDRSAQHKRRNGRERTLRGAWLVASDPASVVRFPALGIRPQSLSPNKRALDTEPPEGKE